MIDLNRRNKHIDKTHKNMFKTTTRKNIKIIRSTSSSVRTGKYCFLKILNPFPTVGVIRRDYALVDFRVA